MSFRQIRVSLARRSSSNRTPFAERASLSCLASRPPRTSQSVRMIACRWWAAISSHKPNTVERSEEHTSELQSLAYLVCRLLLEKKKKKTHTNRTPHVEK